jgi:hypothetical protein
VARKALVDESAERLARRIYDLLERTEVEGREREGEAGFNDRPWKRAREALFELLRRAEATLPDP